MSDNGLREPKALPVSARLRFVAVKTLRALALRSCAARTRFEAEARSVARLDHPNIVRIHESGEQNGVPYFVMEHVAGGSLARKLPREPWAARRAAELVATLADAVEHAHAHGVVHRDLKPANVLLTETGAPKVTDFGLAKLLDDAGGPTLSGAQMGTPAYMAPEAASGQSATAGPAADVFGLGAILYELLTGRAPFQGGSVTVLLEQARRGQVRAPREVSRKVPPALERICLRARGARTCPRSGHPD